MKTRKYITLVMIIIIVLFGIFVFALNLYKGTHKKTKDENINRINEIIQKIDNKESFNLLIQSDKNNLNDELLKYYEDAYKLNFEHLEIDKGLTNHYRLLKKMSFDQFKNGETILAIIKNGEVSSSIIGYFSERDLKQVLINNGLIDKKYEGIDNLIDDSLNAFPKDNKIYNVLYLQYNDKNMYNYRKQLVMDKIPSFVIFAGKVNQMSLSKMIDSELNLNNKNDKLPILLKMRNGKIVSYEFNIAIDNLLEKSK